MHKDKQVDQMMLRMFLISQNCDSTTTSNSKRIKMPKLATICKMQNNPSIKRSILKKHRGTTIQYLQNSNKYKFIEDLYFHYDIWEYIYQCEKGKKEKEGLSKQNSNTQKVGWATTQMKASQLNQSQQKSSISQSFTYTTQHLATNYFKKQFMVYQPSHSEGIPLINGILSNLRRQELKSKCTLFRIYLHWIYESPERKEALQLCGWSDHQDQFFYEYCNQLDVKHLYFRSATVALCHFDFSRALKSLEIYQLEMEQYDQESIKQDRKQSHQNNEKDDPKLAYKRLHKKQLFVHLKKFHEEAKFLIQLIRGLKNISEMVNQDQELKKFFFIQVDEGKEEVSQNFQRIVVQEYQSQQISKIEEYVESNIFSANFDQHELLNINSKKLRFEIIRKTIQYIKEIIANNVFEHPYLQVIARFIGTKNFEAFLLTEIKENKDISIFDKVGMWVRFLSPEKLTDLINSQAIKSVELGLLEWIPLLGRCQTVINPLIINLKSIDILQRYLDITSDVQLVGALSSHLFFLEFPNLQQLAYLSYEYRSLLIRNQWFEERALFDIELNEFERIFVSHKYVPNGLLSQTMNQLEKMSPENQIQMIDKTAVGCKSCLRSLSLANFELKKGDIKLKQIDLINFYYLSKNKNQKLSQINYCPFCNHQLPTCCICNHKQVIPNAFSYLDNQEKNRRAGQTAGRVEGLEKVPIDNALVFCTNCKHGGHYKHIMEYFAIYKHCPVAECQCLCSQV